MEEILSPEQWYELEGRIRQQYPELSDADMQYHEASEPDMIKMVEFTLRRANDVMQGFIDRHYRISHLKYNWLHGRNSIIRQKVK